jgi:hypothetical protein
MDQVQLVQPLSQAVLRLLLGQPGPVHLDGFANRDFWQSRAPANGLLAHWTQNLTKLADLN